MELGRRNSAVGSLRGLTEKGEQPSGKRTRGARLEQNAPVLGNPGFEGRRGKLPPSARGLYPREGLREQTRREKRRAGKSGYGLIGRPAL